MQEFTPPQMQYICEQISARVSAAMSTYTTELEMTPKKNMIEAIDANSLYTVKEVVVFLNYKLSAETVAKYCQSGKLRATKLSGGFRAPWSIRGDSIIALLSRINQ